MLYDRLRVNNKGCLQCPRKEVIVYLIGTFQIGNQLIIHGGHASGPQCPFANVFSVQFNVVQSVNLFPQFMELFYIILLLTFSFESYLLIPKKIYLSTYLF